MKWLVVVVAALCCCLGGNAQIIHKQYNRPYADLKPIHFGFSVGFHVQDLNFTHNGMLFDGDTRQWFMSVPSFAPGFAVNILMDLRLNDFLNVRFTPGMYFGSKNVIMRNQIDGSHMSQEIKSAMAVTPVDLKVSGLRLGDCRPFFAIGAMGAFDVTKRRSEMLWLNVADAYLCVSIGTDFYLKYFKLIPELKFCFGLTDILRHDRPDLEDDPNSLQITQSLKSVRSNLVVLNLYFE